MNKELYKIKYTKHSFEGRSDQFDPHPHWEIFEEVNPWYKDSLDVTKEDYFAIFKTALEIGYELGYDKACDWHDYINAPD